MRRRIETKLHDWKSKKEKKPLVLFGARQTGKTTSLLKFANEFYKTVVYVDFCKQPNMKAAFSGSLEPSKVLSNIEALLRTRIDPKDSILILDGIQDCEEALTSIKFFCTDMPQLDVAAAGSLLGVHVAREGSYPVGYVDIETMHPMDFEEFCWALGEDQAFDLVRSCMADVSECVLHEDLVGLYREYLLVGGMPEAVTLYAQRSSLDAVRKAQRDIRTAYVADMAKYATSTDSAKIIASWESLPTQLAKESGSTKFVWKAVSSGAKADRYATAVDWLVASGIVNRCTQITDGVAPLKSFENVKSFKLYMGDTGLLSCAYDATLQDFEGKDHRSARFRGGIAENYVMQQLNAHDVQPYYWGMQSTQEVEFVLKLKEGVVPIEVKSSQRVRSTSAKAFAEKYGCPYILRVTGKNFGKAEGVINIPLYAAGLIPELL